MKKFLLTLLVLLLTSTVASYGQAISQTGGSIQGSITDPTGATVAGATVVITSPATGYTHTLKTDKAGVYALGPLNPGDYVITITAPSFQKLEVKTVVRVGTVTSGNEKLTVGSAAETVEVSAGEVQINTEQIGVAGVVTREQIDTLPINGRNILDVAQLQPGVVLQSGQDFDPTKTGYSAIGVNGQNGRSTRILLDGQDISDETVGTVLYNVPEGAIGEFQLNRSTQDVSGSVTSTGQVLLATQSGTNRYHGNLFYNFQDDRAGFANVNGAPAPFQRNQFGGYAGGYIIKDKLFFFGGAERIKQFDSSPVTQANANWAAIYSAFPSVPDPFKDTFSMGRLDYNAPWGIHLFARAAYSNNIGFGTEGQAPYALFSNQDNVPSLVGGADFTTGKFTHSVRFGYIKFINNLQGAASGLGSTVYNPSTIVGVPLEIVGSLSAGSGNEDAPQKTYQSSKSFRYDGTWTKGSHSIKFGGEVSRILQGGFASFLDTMAIDVSTAAVHLMDGTVNATSNPLGLGCNAVPGAAACPTDPLNGYFPYYYYLGNGQGSSSERPAFGLAGGGNFSWRIAAYLGDTWKVTPSFTLVAGLRWSVDTDRANQDLPGVACGTLDASLQFSGCDSAHPNAQLFDFYQAGLGGKTQQNYANFGPQVGFVFSPGNHKLAIRGGAGIYYENNLFNNAGNLRAQNTTAPFPSNNYQDVLYTATSYSLPGYFNNAHGVTMGGTPCNIGTVTGQPGCISWPTLFTSYSVAQGAKIMNALQNNWKAIAATPQPNPSYIGYANGDALQASSAYPSFYRTPYSIQVNGGVSYELKKGLVVNADYIHNVTMKIGLSVDVNHVGASRFLNKTAAQNAIAATTIGGTTSSADIDATIAAGATIDDFGADGLDSGTQYLGGYSASANGVTPDFGAAFGGANPNVGVGSFDLPYGKSAYDALQITVQQQKSHPLPGIVSSNLQLSYNLSRFVTNTKGGSNGFFASYGAYDQDCVNCNIGRADSDNSNQFTLGTSFKIKYGAQIGLVGHFFSAPPQDLTLAGITGASQIYKSDFDGDGTTGDLLPGTRPGSYMHEVKPRDLQKVVNNYNATQVGKLTPAGQALVSAGLMSQAQLVALGAVTQPLAPVPANPFGAAATRTLDASVKYPIGYLKRYREGLVLTPGVTMYNVTNMSNYTNSYLGLEDTTATAASINTGNYLNTPNTQANYNRSRVLRGAGNGTFDQGGPRTTEFSLKLEF